MRLALYLRSGPLSVGVQPRGSGSLSYSGTGPIYLPLLRVTSHSASRILAPQHALNYGVWSNLASSDGDTTFCRRKRCGKFWQSNVSVERLG